ENLLPEIRRAAGPGTDVRVAPTPELDALRAGLSEEFEEEPAGYLDSGATPEAVAELFEASAGLFRAAPWREVLDSQPVELDVPSRGVKGACVCIIGNLGQNLGLLIYRSVDDYRTFREFGREALDGDDRSDIRDPGVGYLALSFEKRKVVPR